MLERESFIHMVLRNERILGDVASGVGSATPRSQQSVCQGVSASFGSGSRGGKGADREGASMELRAFGEFLGCRFPSLRAALQAMDLTHGPRGLLRAGELAAAAHVPGQRADAAEGRWVCGNSCSPPGPGTKREPRSEPVAMVGPVLRAWAVRASKWGSQALEETSTLQMSIYI